MKTRTAADLRLEASRLRECAVADHLGQLMAGLLDLAYDFEQEAVEIEAQLQKWVN